MVPSVQEALRALITEMAGRKLPGERELAERLGVSRQRLRSLLDRLETEGLVERRQGSGTYAADRATSAGPSQVALLIDAALKLGEDPFFSLLVERLQLALQASGVRCVIERIDGTERPHYLGEGAILVGLAGRPALAHLRARTDPPAVGLLTDVEREGGAEPALPGACVSLLLADDWGAGWRAAERLLQEGCRRLLFVGRAGLPASGARLRGAQEAAQAAGAEFATWESALNYNAGRAVAAELAAEYASQNTETLGLIVANDWLAVGVRSGLAAAEGGRALRDLPLVSFDGLPIAADPALNIRSLAFPIEAVADDALAELRRLARYPAGKAAGRVIRYSMQWA